MKGLSRSFLVFLTVVVFSLSDYTNREHEKDGISNYLEEKTLLKRLPILMNTPSSWLANVRDFVDTYQDFSEKRRQKKFGMVKFIRNLKNAIEGKTLGLSFNKLVRF